jgi:hypothetical protein
LHRIEGGVSLMKQMRIFFLLSILILIVAALAQGTKSAAAAGAPQAPGAPLAVLVRFLHPGRFYRGEWARSNDQHLPRASASPC